MGNKPGNDARDNHVEVAHLSGPAGIRAAFEMLRGSEAAREAASGSVADAPGAPGRRPFPHEPHHPCGADPFGNLATASEEVPDIHWTCNHCAADNPPDEQFCWCCGAARTSKPRRAQK